MEKYTLSKIFFSLYKQYLPPQTAKQFIVPETIYEKIEPRLEKYILQVMGYKVYNEYLNYKDGRSNDFEYFQELTVFFENFLNNVAFIGAATDTTSISKYGEEFYKEIDEHPYVKHLIDAARKTLSPRIEDTVIHHDKGVYTVGPIKDKKVEVPVNVRISNIDKLEGILEEYIETIRFSDSYYARPFNPESGMSEDEAIEYVLEWTLRNGTCYDLSNIENFFKKYIGFINDKTLDKYKRVTKLGDFLGDELYIHVKRAPVAYETPYYLSFMMRDAHIEFPNIRMGIADIDGRKRAYLLATQTSQTIPENDKSREIATLVKRMLPKSKYFREFNPSHLLSFVFFLGVINSEGINEIEIPDYLPLRFQRFVNEGQMSEEDLYAYQHRLTNKFLNTFLRVNEHTENYDILNYTEYGTPLVIRTTGRVKFDNEFLQNVYNLGYGKDKIKEEEEQEEKTISM